MLIINKFNELVKTELVKTNVIKIGDARSSKIAGVKNRVIVRGGFKNGRWFNFGCSMIALVEKIGGRCADVFIRWP